MTDIKGKIPHRFYSLDAIRGIAALTIVFWHWQHFFFNGTINSHIDKSIQPFYELFFVFYQHGKLAVEFFFSLSGFIFFWLYAERVKKREISAWNFAVLRFSRLYPLHLATLLLVLCGQQIIHRQTGAYFVYAHNDLYHFVLNIFFASNWGFERGFSFNAPIWSVSIEVLLYAIFFALSRKLPARIPILALFVFWGMALESRLGRGMFSFFIGGIVYLIYQKIIEGQSLKKWVKPVVVANVIGWSAIVFEIKYKLIRPAFLSFFQPVLIYNGRDYAQWLVKLFHERFATGILFPITILALVILETQRGTLGKRLSFLGDMSYSSYLLHFPLQLFIMIFVGLLGIDISIFRSEFTLLMFFAILMGLSLMSYRYFEAPVQKVLRRRLLSPKK